jgi:hypothetical protein
VLVTDALHVRTVDPDTCTGPVSNNSAGSMTSHKLSSSTETEELGFRRTNYASALRILFRCFSLTLTTLRPYHPPKRSRPHSVFNALLKFYELKLVLSMTPLLICSVDTSLHLYTCRKCHDCIYYLGSTPMSCVNLECSFCSVCK